MTYNGIEYDVLFDGAHGGENRDLLCVPWPVIPPAIDHRQIRLDEEDQARQSFEQFRARVWQALETQAVWTAPELSEYLGADLRRVSSLIQRWKQQGRLQSYRWAQFGIPGLQSAVIDRSELERD